MVFGELTGGEVNVRIWIHPEHRRKGIRTAALRRSRLELAAAFRRFRWWSGRPAARADGGGRGPGRRGLRRSASRGPAAVPPTRGLRDRVLAADRESISFQPMPRPLDRAGPRPKATR